MALRAVAVSLVLAAASGCGGAGTTADDLVRRLDYDRLAVVVDVARIQDETGEWLGAGDPDTRGYLVSFEGLPHLQLAGFVDTFAAQDMTAYAAGNGLYLMRFAVSADEMADRLRGEGYVPAGPGVFVPGDTVGFAVVQFAAAIGIEQDGDGVVVVVASDRARVDAVLRWTDLVDDQAERYLGLSDDPVRFAFPEGVGASNCPLVALTQSTAGDRVVTAWIEGADRGDLSDAVGDTLLGDVREVTSSDGILAISVVPQDTSGLVLDRVLARIGWQPLCSS